tara:strand:+ start:7028 stop:7612 length:585 start_codon:yes stop_codon:yes gene_type:complete
VPDHPGNKNLSGNLGHVREFGSQLKYLGPLSRFNKKKCAPKYDLLVLLSGPEPQRSYLEIKLLQDLELYKGKVLFIKGKIEPRQTKETAYNITIFNFMTTTELEVAINESDLILSRSGYTTIMDLAKLEKKAFFIPTPGQFEQEYLAEKLMKEGVIPSCSQNKFEIQMLSNTNNYSGFKALDFELNFKELFSLF